MAASAHDARDRDGRRLASLHSRGVDLRPWPPPSDDSRSEGPAGPEHPVLHLVAPDAKPPRCTPFEDWVREPCDDAELAARVDRLALRVLAHQAETAVVDDDGVLRLGDHLVVLSRQEARLARVLLAHRGEVVGRDDLHRAVWGDDQPDDPRALDNRVKALRVRLEGLPLEIHTVRGRGMLLDVALPA